MKNDKNNKDMSSDNIEQIKNKLQQILSKQVALKKEQEENNVKNMSGLEKFKYYLNRFKDNVITYSKQFASYMHGVALTLGDKIQVAIDFITKRKEAEPGKDAKDPNYLVKAAEVLGGDHNVGSDDVVKFRNTKYPLTAGPINFGIWVMFIFIGIGGLWAGLFPIASSSPADGRIISTEVKELQNTNSGSLEIKEIFVKEGDFVKQGEKIIKLDSHQFDKEAAKHLFSRVQYSFLEKRLNSILTYMSDYKTKELSYDNKFFSDLFLHDGFFTKYKDIYKDYNLASDEIKKSQKNFQRDNIEIFNSTIENIQSIVDIHENKVDNLSLSIKHYEQMVEMYRSQLSKQEKLFEERKKVNNNLFEQSQYEQVYHEALKRYKDAVTGLEELQIKMMTEKNEYIYRITEMKSKFMERLDEVRLRLDSTNTDLEKILKMSIDTLKIAPYDLFVVARRYKIGGITQPGVPVVDIVKADIDQNYIISAKVKAQDILSIKKGNKVDIRFAALESSPSSPNFIGHVLSVSKDTVVEIATNRDEDGRMMPGGQSQQMPFYIVKISLDKEQVEKYVDKHSLQGLFPISNMQVSLQIEIGSKTLLQYLITPLAKAWRTALSGSV